MDWVSVIKVIENTSFFSDKVNCNLFRVSQSGGLSMCGDVIKFSSFNYVMKIKMQYLTKYKNLLVKDKRDNQITNLVELFKYDIEPLEW